VIMSLGATVKMKLGAMAMVTMQTNNQLLLHGANNQRQEKLGFKAQTLLLQQVMPFLPQVMLPHLTEENKRPHVKR